MVGGNTSDDPTSPAYVPTLFDHIKSPVKRKAERQFQDMSEQVCLKKGTDSRATSSLLLLSSTLQTSCEDPIRETEQDSR